MSSCAVVPRCSLGRRSRPVTAAADIAAALSLTLLSLTLLSLTLLSLTLLSLAHRRAP
jgi:hypothetical protein